MHACHVVRNAELAGHHRKDTKRENTSFPLGQLVRQSCHQSLHYPFPASGAEKALSLWGRD